MKNCLLTILSALMLLLGSCTTNDGDLSFLGGHWRLDSITVGSDNDDSYKGDITWAFQSNIVEISVLLPNHGRTNHFGTWEFDNNRLTLDFTHRDNDTEAATGEYSLPPQLHLPQGVKVPLRLVNQSGGKMTLTGVDVDNQPITFHLSKIY